MTHLQPSGCKRRRIDFSAHEAFARPLVQHAASKQLFQGWAAQEWRDWVAGPDGSRWCENKRYEADRIVDWMVCNWGLQNMCRGSGVLDVGGEPGFLASALLARGVGVTVVDPTWRITGKAHASNDCTWLRKRHPHLRFAAFSREFDERFIADYPRLVKDASVVVSLYGDEATGPALRFAAEVGKPCVIVPCNECVQFYPDYNKTYEGFCEALLHDAYWYGGHFELVLLTGMPFSRTLLVQNPMGFPHHEYTEPGVEAHETGWSHESGVAGPRSAAAQAGGASQIQHRGFMRASDWERLQQQHADRDCLQTRSSLSVPFRPVTCGTGCC
mmetsp:Transcript_74083/g.173868  ORF Transcript_74083/g.173868 Transcript_74083/m.173868 type:complete len:329 (-) Transcript_74083:83-1069(-)